MIRVALLLAVSTSALAQDWGRYKDDAVKVPPPVVAPDIPMHRRIEPHIQAPLVIPPHLRYTPGAPARDASKRFPEPPKPSR